MNPLLTTSELPRFSDIKPEHILPAVKQRIAENRAVIDAVTAQDKITWDNFILPMDEASEQLSRVWSPVSHLNAVKNSPELRDAYDAALPLLSEYSTWVGQHDGLYQAYRSLKNSPDFATYSRAQQKSIDNALLDFELSGIGLPKAQQQRYGEIVARLSELSSQFSHHVLDATMAWRKVITDERDIAGLPESSLASARALAESQGEEGYLFTLDIPSYLPVMTYCDNAELRFEFYQAFITRASDQGPHAGQWDNSAIMEEILSLRSELATLLGFSSYAEQSLATKMAKNGDDVIHFLNDLARRAKPQAEHEFATLTAFAKKTANIETLNPWDVAYYSEKQKQALYTIDDEQLRPYFPADRVISGLFEVVHRLFGITVQRRDGVEVWDPSVSFYDIFDEKGQYRASFYLDLYARENKQGGAWMDDCCGYMTFADGRVQRPVAYLTCNFTRPTGDKPALFTHDEVITLFHEFGHGLHHMLTEVDVSAVAGIDGVAWDAVELPSQFLENWCWDPEALTVISGHFETGEPLPNALLEKMLATKNYQAALFLMRQLEFALFDFTLHYLADLNQPSVVLNTLQAVRQAVAVTPSVEWARFPHAFSHIFAGGYAAGYYSYLWAQVLSADAFSRFEEEGIFNRATGDDFVSAILSKGGSDDPMVLFQQFRGRAPTLDALLRHNGIAE